MEPRSDSSGEAELGPPLCSGGAPASDNTYRCALRARLMHEFRPDMNVIHECALRAPCMLLIHEMPGTWIDDPDGAIASYRRGARPDVPYRVVSHDWGSDEEPETR